jgi:DNA-binding transcriptional regulator YiaG
MGVTHDEIDLAALQWVRAATKTGRARAIREAARISQPELAERVGVSHAAISRWEAGDRVQRGLPARRYAAALLELECGDNEEVVTVSVA